MNTDLTEIDDPPPDYRITSTREDFESISSSEVLVIPIDKTPKTLTEAASDVLKEKEKGHIVIFLEDRVFKPLSTKEEDRNPLARLVSDKKYEKEKPQMRSPYIRVGQDYSLAA